MCDSSFARFFEYMLFHAISMLDLWWELEDEHDDMLVFSFWQLLFLSVHEHDELDEDDEIFSRIVCLIF